MLFENLTPFETMSDENLERRIATPSRTKKRILQPRSAMMLNPLKLKHLNRIDGLEADIVVVNLEDGVAPQMKKRALLLSAVFISHLKESCSRIVVRINPLDEGGADEIRMLNRVRPDAIRIAKIKTPDEVRRARDLIEAPIDLHLSIETAQALDNLTRLNVDGSVTCASLGIMDMLNDLGLPHALLQRDNPTIHYLLSRFLVESRIAGISPIGFTWQQYEDLESFRQWCLFEKRLGYTAKSCLGPKQVAIANEVFSFTPHALERAEYIKKRFDAMAAENVTGFMDERYGFIDEPIYKDALLTLEKFSVK